MIINKSKSIAVANQMFESRINETLPSVKSSQLQPAKVDYRDLYECEDEEDTNKQFESENYKIQFIENKLADKINQFRKIDIGRGALEKEIQSHLKPKKVSQVPDYIKEKQKKLEKFSKLMNIPMSDEQAIEQTKELDSYLKTSEKLAKQANMLSKQSQLKLVGNSKEKC